MTIHKIKIIFIALCSMILFVKCADDDDNGNVINQISCDDGIQNGDEDGIDCGGTACEPCLEGIQFSRIIPNWMLLADQVLTLYLVIVMP